MRRTCCALLALPLLALVALGDAGPPIQHPGGALPRELKTYARSARPRVVWLAYEGYRPHVLPFAAKDPPTRTVVPKEPLRFMQPFFVADTRNEQDFHLLVTTADGKTVKDYVGWVPGRYLVRSSTASTSEPCGLLRIAVALAWSSSLTFGACASSAR